jgi:hypothetical protein
MYTPSIFRAEQQVKEQEQILLDLLLEREDGGNTFHRNVRKILHDNTAAIRVIRVYI